MTTRHVSKMEESMKTVREYVESRKRLVTDTAEIEHFDTMLDEIADKEKAEAERNKALTLVSELRFEVTNAKTVFWQQVKKYDKRIDELKAELATLHENCLKIALDAGKVKAERDWLREACKPFVEQFDEFFKEQSFTSNSAMSRPTIEFSLLSDAWHNRKGGENE